MAKASKATVQVKKKRWTMIYAPKLFNEMPLGETYVLEPKEALGKVVRVSVMQITGESQKQYISAGFMVTDVAGDKILTRIHDYRILPSALRRLVRRSKDKFEDSIIVTCSDAKLMRIKPFVVARHKAKGSIMTALRKATREVLVKYAAGVTAEQLYTDVISSKLQRTLHDTIRKTYPIGACEIKTLELLKGEGKVPVLPVETKTEAPKTETTEPVAQDAVEEIADEATAEEAAEETVEETADETAEENGAKPSEGV